MKTIAALTLALTLSGAAQALTVTSQPGAPDPAIPAGQTIVVDFDNPNAPGWDWSGGLFTATTTVGGAHAQPAQNTDRYGYVSSAKPQNNATLTTPGVREVSFYWGSIDGHNSVQVFGAGNTLLGTVPGTSFPVFSGNQFIPSTNRRVTIAVGPGEKITALTFRATGVAFEFDDIAAGATVPEPGTWAMLITGFGFIGAMLRRRRPALAA